MQWKLKPLAFKRMICKREVSRREAEYLKALESAERFQVKDGKLYVYVNAAEKPFVFHSAS